MALSVFYVCSPSVSAERMMLQPSRPSQQRFLTLLSLQMGKTQPSRAGSSRYGESSESMLTTSLPMKHEWHMFSAELVAMPKVTYGPDTTKFRRPNPNRSRNDFPPRINLIRPPPRPGSP